MHVTYRVIIEPDQKGFHGYVPALKGCHTWGRTISDTRKKMQEAMELYISVLLEDGEKIPQDQGIEVFETVQVGAPKKGKRVYA